MIHAAPLAGYEYEGAELDLFEHAVNWKRYWSARIMPYVQGDVLEVGAGIGANTGLFSSLPFRSWTCLEPDASLLARIQLPGGARYSTHTGTTSSLGTAQRFDTILYIDVLEHIEGDAEELNRAARHLSPGGRLIVLSPAWPFLYSPFDAAIGHFRRYTRASLRAAASETLLSETALFYLDSAGLLASAANRLLLRSAMPTLNQILLWDRRLIPVSRRIDGLFGGHLGKTVIGVWEKPRVG